MGRGFLAGCTTLAIFALLAEQAAWGLGEESFGNEPLAAANYADWKGIVPLVNDPVRVYHSWVNGNEHFRYHGTTEELNAALVVFANVEIERHEVVLRPGPGIGRSFQGQEVPHRWELHIQGGISKHILTLDQGDKVWSKDPRLTIYVGDGIDLKDLKIPQGVTLVDTHVLSQRIADGMELSKDKTVRGWGCGELAALDPYSHVNLRSLADRLEDQDDWVRRNAASALPKFGRKALVHLPALRKCLLSADANLKSSAADAIGKIELAQDDAEREQAFQTIQRQIIEFVAAAKSSR